MTEDLERKMLWAIDTLEIQQVFNKYIYRLTTMDYQNIYSDCFSQERDDVSIQASDSGVYVGGEHIQDRFFMKFMGFLKQVPGAFTMHFGCNPIIEISEDRMTAKSVILSPGCATDPQNREALWIWGTFTDDYIRENGQWRILHHAFIPLFRAPYDKGWVEQAVGSQLTEVSGKMADRPSDFWNPYNPEKKGDELWATLPTLEDLKKLDF